MKLKKKALLYDITNLAYMIADTGEDARHTLHRVRDICEEGNIDRVARILGLAFADIQEILSTLIISPQVDICRDSSATVHDYQLNFKDDPEIRYALTPERKIKIKETAHEYMVSMVLADWLAMTLPEAADIWRFRLEKAREELSSVAGDVMAGSCAGFRRTLSPF